jgi:hypothetical protein
LTCTDAILDTRNVVRDADPTPQRIAELRASNDRFRALAATALVELFNNAINDLAAAAEASLEQAAKATPARRSRKRSKAERQSRSLLPVRAQTTDREEDYMPYCIEASSMKKLSVPAVVST